MRKAVDTMILNDCSSNRISQCLKSLGISNSRQAISNYCRNYFQPPKIKDRLIPFACDDIGGRGHRQKKVTYIFEESTEKVKETVKNFSAENSASDKPEALEDSLNSSEIDIDFIPNFNNSKIKTLAKEQANRRLVYEQLHRS